ncbi:TPA: hypothetical protein I6193_001985 [Vibrio cholerae]|nr:hypothetical protein [Vibrio cholerae]
MLRIEIFKENERAEPRTINGKNGKPPRTIYEQTAYVYLGGKFPVEMKLGLQEGQPPYAPGIYTPHSSSYLVNPFGGLELKKYGLIIEPLEAPEL